MLWLIPADNSLPPPVRDELQRQACEEVILRLVPGMLFYPAFIAMLWAATDYPTAHPAGFAAAALSVVFGVACRAVITRWRNPLLARYRSQWLSVLAASTISFALPGGLLLAHAIARYGYSNWNYSVVLLWTTGLAAGAIVSYTPSFQLMRLHVLGLLLPPLVTSIALAGPYTLPYASANVLMILFSLGQGKRLHRAHHERALDLYREAERRREVEAARAAADAASRAKSEFLANMSHEIRTPLHGILGMADLTLEGDLLPRERDQILTLSQSATSLLQILNDILDLSKVEAGRLELESLPFSPSALVEECCRTFAAQAALKGLTLVPVIDCAAGPPLLGDPTRIRQVLLNLMGNAIKFTPAGQVRVELCVLPAPADDHWNMRLAVGDSGPGIPQDKQALIFEAFSQADNSVARRHGGTGLGLAISSRLVNLMGSHIELDSAPGRGSRFSFTIQLAAAQTAPAQHEEASLAISGLRILVAEDNPVNQHIAVTVLQRMGHDVTLAGDGEEAIRRFEGGEFDIVLMDSHMPDMDGLTATAHLRRREAARGGRTRTPVIAVTADAMAGARDRYLAAGFDDYLAKPYRPAELAAALRRNAPAAESLRAAQFAG